MVPSLSRWQHLLIGLFGFGEPSCQAPWHDQFVDALFSEPTLLEATKAVSAEYVMSMIGIDGMEQPAEVDRLIIESMLNDDEYPRFVPHPSLLACAEDAVTVYKIGGLPLLIAMYNRGGGELP